MKCPKCQTDNTDTATFCADCGTKIISPKDIPVTETTETPKEELTTGSTFFERYQIIKELGRGGMGRVYKATDTKIKEKVALKLIKPEIASDKKTLERFSNGTYPQPVWPLFICSTQEEVKNRKYTGPMVPAVRQESSILSSNDCTQDGYKS